MKRIVAGLDVTPQEAVVDWIERFAADTGVHVVVVHAVPRTVLWTISSVQADFTTYLDSIRKQLEQHVVGRLHNKGISADLVISRGDPAHALARTAASVDADMIVLGGARHTALHDVVFGGTARHVERLTDVPVVVVPLRNASLHAVH